MSKHKYTYSIEEIDKLSDYKPGDLWFDASSNTTITWDGTGANTVTLPDPYQEQIDDLNRKFDKIMDRLGVLDDPDPEKLEKHKALKRAYEKYKMLEKLCGEGNEEDQT